MVNEQARRNRETKCVDKEVDLLLADLEKLKDRRKISRDQVQATIQDLVEMVDSYFTFSAFEFLSCADGQSESNFHCPSPWEWSIEPDISVGEKRIERYEKFLGAVFANKKPSFESNLENTVVDLTTHQRKQGFYMGILVGVKMMGASTKQMHQFGKRLVEVIQAEPRYQK